MIKSGIGFANHTDPLFFYKKSLGFFLCLVVLYITAFFNLWHSSLLPFTDLPNHLLEAYIWQGHLSSVYGTNVFVYSPASLHTIFCALFSDVETGNRVFYSIYTLLLPLTMLFLIRMSQGEKWLGLLSFCFLYSYSVTWGFSSFTLGTSLILLAVYFYIRLLSRPSLMRFFTLTCLLILTFYAHAILFLFAGAVLGCCTVALRKISIKQRLLAISTALPSLVIFTFWILQADSWRTQQSTFAFLAHYYIHDYIASLPLRVVHLLTADNSALASGLIGNFLSLIWSVPLLLLVPLTIKTVFSHGYHGLCSLLHIKSSIPPPANCALGQNGTIEIARSVGLIFFCSAVGCFLLLPDQIPGQWVLYERFSVMIFLSLIWIGSFSISAQDSFPEYRRILQSLIVILTMTHAVLWSHYFWQFGYMTSGFEQILRNDPALRGKSLAAVIGEPTYRGKPVLIHFQNYHALWNKGPVPTKAVEYRFRLIDLKKDVKIPIYTVWLKPTTDIGNPLKRYEGMDFLLAHGPPLFKAVEKNGSYSRHARMNDWAIYRGTGDK